MIQVILLTGFLGSGKTTLLQKLLNDHNQHRIGVIVNEFGDINVDSDLLKQAGIEISQMQGGSIFCACIKDHFVQSLIEMSHFNLDYLFIEASGMADPSSMTLILDAIAEQTKHPLCYVGSICVLDGESFLEQREILSVINRQLQYAGTAIVNKEDLISASQHRQINEAIQEINPHIDVHFTSYCSLDQDLLFSRLKPPATAGTESSNTPSNRLTSYLLKVKPEITRKQLEDFLLSIAPATYRIKGFVKISDAFYSVSCVRSHLVILPWKGEIEKSELVVISAVGIRLMGFIAAAKQAYVGELIQL